jgi:hypothetical protein
MKKQTPDELVKAINQYEKRDNAYWVIVMARECNNILINRLNDLLPCARIAVEFYGGIK